jgi:hypothetical protein
MSCSSARRSRSSHYLSLCFRIFKSFDFQITRLIKFLIIRIFQESYYIKCKVTLFLKYGLNPTLRSRAEMLIFIKLFLIEVYK